MVYLDNNEHCPAPVATMNRRWLAAVATFATVGLSVGCGGSVEGDSSEPVPATEQFVNWPTMLKDFRYHWTAEPGITLDLGPAVIVRAYLESFDIAGKTGDFNNVYPGFYRSTPENLPREGNYLWQSVRVRPSDNPVPGSNLTSQQFGYQTFHIVDLMPMGNGFRAQVCSYNYTAFVASETHPGKFASVALNEGAMQPDGDPPGIFVYQVDLTQHDPRVGPNPPPPVTIPQSGAAPAPADDVFGNWFITAASQGHWGRVQDGAGAVQDQLTQRCVQEAPENEAERRLIVTTLRDTQPPHDKPIPGWPMTPN